MKEYVNTIARPEEVIVILDDMMTDYKAGCVIRQEEASDQRLYQLRELKRTFRDMIEDWPFFD